MMQMTNVNDLGWLFHSRQNGRYQTQKVSSSNAETYSEHSRGSKYPW